MTWSWDKEVAARVLSQALDAGVLFGAAGGPAPGVDWRRGVAFEVDANVNEITLTVRRPQPAPASAEAAMAAAIKRRLRRSGIRCQILLEPLAAGNGGNGAAGGGGVRAHITPLRGTRASALRYIACKKGLDMGAFTLVSCCTLPQQVAGAPSPAGVAAPPPPPPSASAAASPPSGTGRTASATAAAAAAAGKASRSASGALTGPGVEGEGPPRVVGFATSDGEDLVGGAAPVVLLPVPAAAAGLAWPVDIGPFRNRVQLLAPHS